MVGARVRRQQVAYARRRGLSSRRACAVLSVARSTLALGLVFGLASRQTEGFLRSLLLTTRPVGAQLALPQRVLGGEEHVAVSFVLPQVSREMARMHGRPNYPVGVHALGQNVEPVDEEEHPSTNVLRKKCGEDRLTCAGRHDNDAARPAHRVAVKLKGVQSLALDFVRLKRIVGKEVGRRKGYRVAQRLHNERPPVRIL